MKRWLLVLIITILFAVPTFMLGQVIWPSAPEMPSPTPEQLPFFMIISAIESIGFGLGISFLILAFPLIKRIKSDRKGLLIASYISIIWLLVSWWPHDNLHRNIGMDLQKLLYIEYGFHFTLIIAGSIIAYGFFRMLKNKN